MQSNKIIKILVATHKPYWMPSDEVYLPIHVGAEGKTDENGKPYSPVYLKTLHNQLSALFNHAVKYYGLHDNPAAKVGNMGKERSREMLFWTQEEYAKFADEMMDKPVSYYAFEMLYWCGIREGELLALTPEDFDFDKGTVSISKTYNRIFYLVRCFILYLDSAAFIACKSSYILTFIVIAGDRCHDNLTAAPAVFIILPAVAALFFFNLFLRVYIAFQFLKDLHCI